MAVAAEVKSRIAIDVDFDREGRQASYLRAPLSSNTAGWGTVEIPIVVVKNGSGPTVLLTAGIHGDEYEGQIAIARLAQQLDPAEVSGRVIMLQAVNIAAALNGTRLSPIDDRDLNRCFPGDPRGTFSYMLAHFLDGVVLPHADISVDVHSAGHSFDSALSTNMHSVPDLEIRRRTLAAASAFGAPYNVVFWSVDEGATFTSCVERRGLISLGTELGGWGRVNVEGVRIAERGIRNVLKHFGVLQGAPETAQRDGTPGTRHMMVRDQSYFSFAPANGLFEPRHLAGQNVAAGEIAGFLHFIEDIDRPPVEVRYRRDGVLWMSPGPGRVRRGDAIAVVMTDYAED
ncbi:MAG: succinylglutamate desuccinylase/aspartoacylase family protein [Dongiaceae bacterium]